jgi:LytS/YehU family sensor histidine kinase
MLGYVLISRTHVVNVLQRKAQWVYSIWLLALMWVMTILGFYFGLNGQAYVFLSTNIMGGTYAAINGVQGFFVLPAAYRAFRARNLESAILLIVGILIIFTNVSVGGALWPDALKIRTWLLNVPVAGAERGIMIAAAIGYIGILLRAMVGLETNWLGAEAKE